VNDTHMTSFRHRREFQSSPITPIAPSTNAVASHLSNKSNHMLQKRPQPANGSMSLMFPSKKVAVFSYRDYQGIKAACIEKQQRSMPVPDPVSAFAMKSTLNAIASRRIRSSPARGMHPMPSDLQPARPTGAASCRHVMQRTVHMTARQSRNSWAKHASGVAQAASDILYACTVK
jgi:hypothetical protein